VAEEFKNLASIEKIEELEKTKWKRAFEQIKKDWPIYVMLIPVIIFFILFRYRPIGGLMVAFKRTESGTIAISDRPFAGFYNFKVIMFGEQARDFWKAFRNTFTLSAYGLFFGFPVPIIIALLFSEIKVEGYRAVTQIITYLPKFISTVVITSILTLMLQQKIGQSPTGIINQFLVLIRVVPDGTPILQKPEYFRTVYILSGIWEGAGYGSIVYFAAIMAISPTNYEAAKIDGASKLDQIRYITFPGMAPTLTIMLILRIGEILNVGYEKVILLNGDSTGAARVADVLSTYVIRLGSIGATSSAGSQGVGYGAAADLFNSLIAMLLVLGANYVSKKVSETSLF
jgi:putative aldouronate transport system permease protein